MHQGCRRCSVGALGVVVLLVGDADVAWQAWRRRTGRGVTYGALGMRFS
jgi:hypothetical protein